jgi:translocator protein
MKSRKQLPFISKLIIAILICELTGIISSFISMPSMYPWYAEIEKPTWNPPSSVFAPVWTSIYFLMGISLALVWRIEVGAERRIEKQNALRLFGLQLFLNFWWSIVFFKFHSLSVSLLVILLMIVTIIMTIFKFAPFSKVASWLLIPYISWVCFATVLNFTIWQLNQ